MAKKKEVVAEVKENSKKAAISDFDVIIEPLITEKTMSASQEGSKFSFIVKKDANKTQIKNAINKIYNVNVKSVNVSIVPAKVTTRGTRHKGTISGFKKATVTLKAGETINLFAE